MIAHDKPNPFSILALPTDASEADIAQRAQELSDLADTDEERLLYRWAREQVITHPRTRLEYEVFEVPGTEYDDAEWERFERRYRRNPIDLQADAAATSPPTAADFDLAALIRILLDGLLAVPAPDLGPLLASPPVGPGQGPPSVEARDVVFG